MASGAFASADLVRQGRGRLILEIDISERLAVVVADNKTGVLFHDGPWRREAASGLVQDSSGRTAFRNALFNPLALFGNIGRQGL